MRGTGGKKRKSGKVGVLKVQEAVKMEEITQQSKILAIK